ncbi:MAG: redoxin domain-containing protein [Pseudomonadota bacterium]
MADTLTTALLIVLIPAVALNLWLTLRLSARLRQTLAREAPLTCTIDAPVPAFSGSLLEGGTAVDASTLAGQANVLVFLSSACGDCRSKLPVLEDLLEPMSEHGVRLWLISQEPPARLRKFIQRPVLRECLVRVDRRGYQRLNPRYAAPFYLFVDDSQVVRAGNFIGDENWRAFVEQIRTSPSIREAS